MRSRSPVRALLPAAQALAEGGWLAVLYAAAQAASGDRSHLGPIELGAAALVGMAWGRRRGLRTRTARVIGLPLLALVAGAIAWLLDPAVRVSLFEGNFLAALGTHAPAWLTVVAFWRGEAHRIRGDDALIQDRLLRWAVPALAIPWLLGYASASGQLEEDFAAAAFVGTVVFSVSAFTALGLARLEAVQLSTGSDPRSRRSWLLMILGMAVAVTVITLPAAALLGITGRSLLAILVAPLQTFILIIVLLTAPIFLLAAFLADLLGQLIPEDFRLRGFQLPSFNFSGEAPTSDLPGIIITIVVGSMFLIEILILLAMGWAALSRKWRIADPPSEEFEERSIVVPTSTASDPVAAAATIPRRRIPTDDPTGAYLAALAELATDGRWPRRGHESPAAHLQRARDEGLQSPSFGRLTAAYQIARYSPRALIGRERQRARARLNELQEWLRRTHRS